MKSIPRIVSTGRLFTAGLLLGCSGCTAINTRQPTSEMSTVAALAQPLSQDFEAPVPLRTVEPEYPIDLKRAGITGVVRLNCLVDENGGVQSVKVEETADSNFTQPAVNALKQWTFKPGRRDGVAVSTRVSIPFQFKFDE